MIQPVGMFENDASECYETRERLVTDKPRGGVQTHESPFNPSPRPRELRGSLGRFRILEKIGEGGMGQIYAAWDSALHRKVALKVMRCPDASAQLRSVFEREVRSLAVISHPNVVTIHDFCSDGPVCFAVMELLDGSSLRVVLQKGPLPLLACLRIASQIATGLAAAHERGIVHRDVKPDNIRITSDGRVKLVDFGLSQRSAASQRAAVTPDGREPLPLLAGTVAYMSPEQARGLDVDCQSDVFSLGIVLYEMLTGNHPFVAETAAETLHAIVTQPSRRVPIRGRLSGRALRVALRCLNKSPEQRYGLTNHLARLLRRLHRESASRGIRRTTGDRARGGFSGDSLVEPWAAGYRNPGAIRNRRWGRLRRLRSAQGDAPAVSATMSVHPS